MVLTVWPGPQVQKQAHHVVDIMKRGLTDADVETRRHSREAFLILQSKYVQLANSVVDALDAQQRRQLQAFLATTKSVPLPHPHQDSYATNGPQSTSSLSRQGNFTRLIDTFSWCSTSLFDIT